MIHPSDPNVTTNVAMGIPTMRDLDDAFDFTWFWSKCSEARQMEN
jgi:hypothetical protein